MAEDRALDQAEATFEDARATDLGEVSALIRSANSYQGRWSAQVEGRELSEEYLRSVSMVVARRGDDVVAFFSIEVPGRGGHGQGELDWMVVRDDFQGSGLGRLLLEEAKARARELGLDSLVVVAHPPAEGFYLRCGAVRTGTLAPQGKAMWERPVLEVALKP
jgi:GNAT superfamily N-acetyltransferase